MNPYFFALAVYGFLITPLSVRFRVLAERDRVRLWLSGNFGGVPLVVRSFALWNQRRRLLLEQQGAGERTQAEVDPSALLSVDPALRAVAFAPALWRRALQAVHVRTLYFSTCVALPDASATALLTAALRALESVCRTLDKGPVIRAEADFTGTHGALELEGIFFTRTGSLLRIAGAALRLWARARKRGTGDATPD